MQTEQFPMHGVQVLPPASAKKPGEQLVQALAPVQIVQLAWIVEHLMHFPALRYDPVRHEVASRVL